MNKCFSVAIAIIFVFFLLPFGSIAQQYRLVKKTRGGYSQTSSPVFTVVDSTIYTYQWQSGRGSNYNNDTIRFDQAHYYHLRTPSPAYQTKETHTYTTGHILLTSITHEYDANNGVWKPTVADSFTVNNGQVSGWRYYSIHNNQLVNNGAYNYSYDAQGRLVLQERLGNDTAWQLPLYPKQRNYYRYDNNGRLLVDSNVYLLLGNWDYIARTEHSYDANGNRIRSDVYGVSAGVLNLAEQQFYDYNTSGQLVRDSLSRFFPSHNYETHLYTYNAQGLLESDTFRSNVTPGIALTIYQYTSFGYVSEMTYADIDPTTKQAIPFYATRYDYQLYWPVGIKETSTNNNGLTLYPNPATDVLHINSEQIWEHGRIYNSTGQVVKELPYRKQVIISDLPAGNYFIQLVRGTYVRTGSFVVVR